MNLILINQLKKEIDNGKKIIEMISSRNRDYEQFLELAEKDNLPPYESVQNVAIPDLIKVMNAGMDYPDYPFEGKLFEKLQYLEDKHLKFWSLKQMNAIIEKIEGAKSEDVLKNASQMLNHYVKRGELLCMKYNNSNFYAFYTTRREWVENIKTVKGKKRAEIVPGREPDNEFIKNLTDDQKAKENITWSGL